MLGYLCSCLSLIVRVSHRKASSWGAGWGLSPWAETRMAGRSSLTGIRGVRGLADGSAGDGTNMGSSESRMWLKCSATQRDQLRLVLGTSGSAEA